MIRYLLDINVISEPARPKPADRVIERLEAHSGEVALPSVVWHELVYGVERMDEGRRRSYLADYLSEVLHPSMPIIPYDQAAARWHGKARAGLEAQGQPRPFADGQIAAIAATRDLILVTRNTSDFAPFDGLHVENWFDA